MKRVEETGEKEKSRKEYGERKKLCLRARPGSIQAGIRASFNPGSQVVERRGAQGPFSWPELRGQRTLGRAVSPSIFGWQQTRYSKAAPAILIGGGAQQDSRYVRPEYAKVEPVEGGKHWHIKWGYQSNMKRNDTTKLKNFGWLLLK